MKKRGVGIGISFYGTGYGNGFPDISRVIIRLSKRKDWNILWCKQRGGEEPRLQ